MEFKFIVRPIINKKNGQMNISLPSKARKIMSTDSTQNKFILRLSKIK